MEDFDSNHPMYHPEKIHSSYMWKTTVKRVGRNFQKKRREENSFGGDHTNLKWMVCKTKFIDVSSEVVSNWGLEYSVVKILYLHLFCIDDFRQCLVLVRVLNFFLLLLLDLIFQNPVRFARRQSKSPNSLFSEITHHYVWPSMLHFVCFGSGFMPFFRPSYLHFTKCYRQGY